MRALPAGRFRVRFRRRILLLAAALWGTAVPLALGQNPRRVKNSVHNLSVSGPGTIRAQDETEICVFCHTPHGSTGVQPLWNRDLPVGPYLIYQSTSLDAKVGQPTGSSKLCLSCHDGTIALGDLHDRALPVPMVGGDRLPPGPSNLGTDLSDDHPISFSYAASFAANSTELVPPATIPPPITLDPGGEVQCTSCHEPHDNTNGDFLLRPRDSGQLCTSCHRPLSWSSSAHATAAAVIPAGAASVLGTGEVTMGRAACDGCHGIHAASGPAWLLDGQNISATCVVCHDGQVAQYDIEREIRKPSGHALSTEGFSSLTRGPFVEGDRVSCSDCHEPHAAGSPEELGSDVPASLARVPGVRLSGEPLTPVDHEYELCFRCHGDEPARLRRTYVNRVIEQPNLRLQFQPTNPSFHPVGGPGANPIVPSLIPPLTTSSVIQCGDCHASDGSRRLGGTAPAGPHGSIFEPLLALRYDRADFSAESPSAYALCYRCHQRESILRGDSFRGHREHIVEERAPCSICHDPHGISSAQGNSTNNGNLMNFDRSVVFPSASGRLEYVDMGGSRGECYLNCHGEEHNPRGY